MLTIMEENETYYDFPIGLLINFGAQSLQFKKVFNPKYNLENPKIK
jgi:hypothetical protein